MLNVNQLSGEIPSEIGKLTNLEGLGLAYNQFAGEIPPEVGDLKNLSGLNLSFNQNQILKYFPSCCLLLFSNFEKLFNFLNPFYQ